MMYFLILYHNTEHITGYRQEWEYRPGAGLLHSAHSETRQQDKMQLFFRQGDSRVVLNMAEPDGQVPSSQPTNEVSDSLQGD